MANGNKKITSPLEFKDGKLIVGQGIDAFQIAVDKEGGLLVEDPTTRIAGNYPDMYPWKAPEGYPEAAISFAKDGSYPPDNIPVSCLAGAIRALKQLVLHTSTGVDTPPPDDPDTSLALGVEDGDLVVIASDGMWHKATPPILEPSPEPTLPPTEGGDVPVLRLVRQYEPEAFALASMMLFTGVYIEKLGQVVTSNYVSHPDWHFPSGAVLYLDPNNPGKMTAEDTGYPVGICQLPSDYGTTIYLEPLMWGIDKGINDSRRASYEVATGLTAALEAQKTELTEQMKAAHDLIDEHIQALNTSVESLQQFQATQEALNDTFATQRDIENVRVDQEALGTRIDNLVTEQEELKTETERLAAEDSALHQSISAHETAVATRFDELDTSIDNRFASVTQATDELREHVDTTVGELHERLDSGDIQFWHPKEPLPFTPIDLKRCLVQGDMTERIFPDMAVRIQPSWTDGIYVESVTYDEVTQFSTIMLSGEFKTGDNQLQYGLPKDPMPRMEGATGPAPEVDINAVVEQVVEKLPSANTNAKGLVKLDGVTMTTDANGNLKAVYTAENGTIIETPPVATEQVAGIVRPDGTSIIVSSEGVISSVGGSGVGDYTLPVATADTLGGIKIGENLSITEDGTLSATGGGSATLPDVIPVDKLPVATSYSPGVVTLAERVENGGLGMVSSDLLYNTMDRLENISMNIPSLYVSRFDVRKIYFPSTATTASTTVSVSIPNVPKHRLCFIGFRQGVSYSPYQALPGGSSIPATWIYYPFTGYIVKESVSTNYEVPPGQVSMHSSDVMVTFQTGSSNVNHNVYDLGHTDYPIGYNNLPIVFLKDAVTVTVNITWVYGVPRIPTVVAPVGDSVNRAYAYAGMLWLAVSEVDSVL